MVEPRTGECKATLARHLRIDRLLNGQRVLDLASLIEHESHELGSLLDSLETECPEQFMRDGPIHVVAAELTVAARGPHLKDPLVEDEHRDIERPPPQVVHGERAIVLSLEPVRECRGRRLVEKAQHVQTGETCSVSRGLPLGVIEIRRNGDHGGTDVP